LPIRDIKLIRVPVPPLFIQNRIASILGAYDDLIEVNRRRIAVLEEMTRRLFEEWFGRFRNPGQAAKTAVSKGGALPDGWGLQPLSSCVRFVRGRSYRSVDLVEEGGKPFVNLKCFLRDGGFRQDGMKRYRGEYKPEQLVSEGDIVLAVTDMTQDRRIVGQAARIPRLDDGPAVISMDTLRVVPGAEVAPTFLYLWLRFSDFSAKAAQRANGANVLHLSPSSLEDFLIELPPSLLQLEFTSLIDPMLELADRYRAAERRLAASRDLLLSRLVSGELSVDAGERELAKAAA
jgi:type I restriction enzyme S subunit